MPRFITPRSQRTHVEPYDRTRQTTIARLRAANEEIKYLRAQLDTAKAGEEHWKVEYDLINEMVDVMLRHVKRLLNGFEDSGEVKETELLLRLRMMNIRKLSIPSNKVNYFDLNLKITKNIFKMPRSSSSVGSSSRYSPYGREDQSSQEKRYRQQSEALHNASDLARIRVIDDNIESLYQERDVLVERVDPSDLVQFLSNSEAQDFDGNMRRTRPTWAMIRELIRQKKSANKKVRDLLEKCESLERNTSLLVFRNSANKVERCVREKEKVQQDLRLAQSEIPELTQSNRIMDSRGHPTGRPPLRSRRTPSELELEVQRLRDENAVVRFSNNCLQTDYNRLLTDHNRLLTGYNRLLTDNNNLNRDLERLKSTLRQTAEDNDFIIRMIQLYGSQVVIPPGYDDQSKITMQLVFRREGLSPFSVNPRHISYRGYPTWVCSKEVNKQSYSSPPPIHPPLTSCPAHGPYQGCKTMVQTVPHHLRYILNIVVADIPRGG
ncbi:unnamed protein product [Fusarium langsethiae]|nr:unnamed protein product [Fusarium langsethiae]